MKNRMTSHKVYGAGEYEREIAGTDSRHILLRSSCFLVGAFATDFSIPVHLGIAFFKILYYNRY